MNKKYVIETMFKALDRMSPALKTINRHAKKHYTVMKRATMQVRAWAKASAGALRSAAQWATLRITAPLLLVGTFAARAGMELEKMRISFDTFLGSAERGGRVLHKLLNFANVTPFETKNVVGAGRSLMAMGVATENVMERVAMLGDLAAGTGVPLREFAVIFGKLKGKGKAQAEELNQLAERGVPIMSILAKGFGTDKISDIYKLGEKGLITYEVLLAAMQSLTREGGLFYNMTAKLAKSYGGLLSTIRGVFWLAGGQMAQVMADTMNLRGGMESVIKWAGGAAEALKKWVKVNPELAKMATYFLLLATVSAPLLAVLSALAFAIWALMTPIGLTVLAVAGIVIGLGALAYWLDNTKTFLLLITVELLLATLAFSSIWFPIMAAVAAFALLVSYDRKLGVFFGVVIAGLGAMAAMALPLTPLATALIAIAAAIALIADNWALVKQINWNYFGDLAGVASDAWAGDKATRNRDLNETDGNKGYIFRGRAKARQPAEGFWEDSAPVAPLAASNPGIVPIPFFTGGATPRPGEPANGKVDIELTINRQDIVKAYVNGTGLNLFSHIEQGSYNNVD